MRMTQKALEDLANKAVPDAGASDLNRLAVLADIALSLRRIADRLEAEPAKETPQHTKKSGAKKGGAPF
jgi:hypothetical protein